jgi:hypothetical protein
MKCFCGFLAALLLSSVLFSAKAASPVQDIAGSYSFENDMEGWIASAADVEAPGGGGSEPWSVTRSQDIANDGTTSVKLFLHNFNDGGKVFIEKPFEVEPGQIYQVHLEYAFASRDLDLTVSYVMAGVLTKPPVDGNDLGPAMKETSSNGNHSIGGYVWLSKDYDFTVRSEQNALFVVIGIWGVFEVPMQYYLDNVRVTIAKKPDDSQFYSFENDLEGWSAKATDLESPAGSSDDWSIARSSDIWEDGANSLRFDLNSLNQNGKIWIERPFLVEPGRKYKVTLDYAFHAYLTCAPPRFRIITGVFRSPPQTADDLSSAFQQKTTDTNCTWGWLHRTYNFTVKSKKSQALYVVIGLWGTEQVDGIFNIDSVCVTIVTKST